MRALNLSCHGDHSVLAVMLAAELIVSLKWFSGIFHAGAALYLVYLFIGKKLNMQAADAFKQVDLLRERRFEFFLFHCCSFLLITFRLVGEFLGRPASR